MISGHITVCKIYKDGTRKVVLDKSNLITKGLGSSYIDILENTGSPVVEDYRPRFFQIGTSSMGYDTQSVGTDTSAYFYQLSTPLHWSSYGNDTDLFVESRDRGFYASTINPGELIPGMVGQVTGTELVFSSAPLSSAIFSSVENSSSWFATISKNNVTKWFMDSCEIEIILDEATANGNTISEIGLFSKNPRGVSPITPLLMAYKKFTGIPKNSNFSLAFYWNIGFMGTSSLDRNYTGDEAGQPTVPPGYTPFHAGAPTPVIPPPTFNTPQAPDWLLPPADPGTPATPIVEAPLPTTPTEPGDYGG